MNKLLVLVLAAAFMGCAESEFSAYNPADDCSISGRTISCADGTIITIEDGKDGDKGNPGQGGEPGTISEVTNVPKNSCVQIGDSLWAENIRSGEIFDVYSNNQCKDALGEHCDNVVPSYGVSGLLGAGQPGSGTVCSISGTLVFGNVLEDDSLDITVVDFLQ